MRRITFGHFLLFIIFGLVIYSTFELEIVDLQIEPDKVIYVAISASGAITIALVVIESLASVNAPKQIKADDFTPPLVKFRHTSPAPAFDFDTPAASLQADTFALLVANLINSTSSAKAIVTSSGYIKIRNNGLTIVVCHEREVTLADIRSADTLRTKLKASKVFIACDKFFSQAVVQSAIASDVKLIDRSTLEDMSVKANASTA